MAFLLVSKFLNRIIKEIALFEKEVSKNLNFD